MDHHLLSIIQQDLLLKAPINERSIFVKQYANLLIILLDVQIAPSSLFRIATQ